MNNGLKIAGGIGAIIGLLIVAVIINPVIGMFAGAAFGFLFNDTATLFLASVGLGNMEFWQFGGVVGFVGGFFKAVVQQKG